MFLRISFLAIALSLGLWNGCATHSPSITQQDSKLTELMISRLEISREVAWIKFQNHIPVRDPKREAELIARMVSEGEKLGLQSAVVSAFFRAQIDASCQVQQESLRYWQRGGTLPTYPPSDLKRDIRPRLDALGTKLLQELVRVERTNASLKSYTYASIRQKGFSWRVARIATAPLD